MTTKKPKKNPQDATLRNINALKRRVKALENWCFGPWGKLAQGKKK